MNGVVLSRLLIVSARPSGEPPIAGRAELSQKTYENAQKPRMNPLRFFS
jgi:hypothetical protein